jgi:hypothetical protein
VLAVALRASKVAEGLRLCGDGSVIAASIQEIYSDMAGRQALDVDDIAERYFPDRPRNIVPLAISLALVTQSAERAALLAANLGGDSDSVASIGGAFAGALRPESVHEGWFEVVNKVNGDDIVEMAISLAAFSSNSMR